MAEAYADDTELGCASCKVCVCKGLAEGVGEDGGSHKEDVIKELHEDRVVAKGDHQKKHEKEYLVGTKS